MGNPRRDSTARNPAPRIERRIIEKNRRNRMKILYSNLIHFLPDEDTSKVEGLPLPDQIDEAVEYIKRLQTKVEGLKQKKELLLQGKRSTDSCITNTTGENQVIYNTIRPPSLTPLVQVHNMGPNLDVVLANGIQDYSKFNDIIRLIHRHGVEIAGAIFARDGNSTLQLLKDKVVQNKGSFEGEIMAKKLNELVSGPVSASSTEVVESGLSSWDYEIESNIWGFEVPQVFDAGTNFDYYDQDFLNMGTFNL